MNEAMGGARGAETPARGIVAAALKQSARPLDGDPVRRAPRSPTAERGSARNTAGSRSTTPKAKRPRATPASHAFEPHRLVAYDDASLIEELQRVAALIKERAMTAEGFRRHSRVHYRSIARRFGGWRKALARAGLMHRHPSQTTPAYYRMHRTQALSKKAIVAELRALARRNGGRVTKVDLLQGEGLSVQVLIRRFGGWRKALAAAGIKAVRKSWCTSEELYANLLRVWRHCGRSPRQIDMHRKPSMITTAPYLRRFGSWVRTITAFAALANAGGPPDAFVPQDRALPKKPGGKRRPATRRGRQRAPRPPVDRSPPLALRYRILTRDRFRCVACGDNPAANPGCKLQIDHIVPFSKGGRTEPSNLRTLCQACNIGRGNRGESRGVENTRGNRAKPL